MHIDLFKFPVFRSGPRNVIRHAPPQTEGMHDLAFHLSAWLMIQGTRESKILGGGGCFVRFSYFKYVTCCRLSFRSSDLDRFRCF